MPTQMITLRDYQRGAITAIEQAEARGVRRPLVALPTGTGKTIVFAELIRQRRGRALVLAHRDELIGQAVAKIRLVHPEADLGVVKAGRDETGAQVVVASVQTLSRPHRLSRLTPDFHTTVIDEAHHATADSYRRILEHVGSFRDDGPLTLGVTATPERADGAPLGDIWQEIVYRCDLLPMIQAGYLSDLRAIQVHLEADLDQVHTRAGDLKADELDNALRQANAPEHAVTAYHEHAAGRTALIFTPTVQSAHEMAAAFCAAGVTAEWLSGETDPEERRALLRRFHEGDTRVVANCAVLTEGFDEPSIDCIIVARPTKSRPLYVQMLGRGTRRYPGKRDCLILDLVGSTTRHDLQTTADLFGLPAADLETQPLTAVVENQRAATPTATAPDGQLVATAVDLFQRRPLHWISSAPTRHVLSIGDGVLLLRSDGLQTWCLEHIPRDSPRRMLADGLSLEYGQGVAEDEARRLGASRLVARGAAWRQHPATPGQLHALRQWRMPIPANVTKGIASDLITAAAARVA